MYVGVAIAQCLVVAACEPRLGGIPLAVLVGWPVAFLAMARPSLVGPAFPTAQVIRAPLPHRTTV
jgi:hypothetical protein